MTGGFFFRNPNTRGGVFSIDGGQTLLIGDALMAAGMGSASCPTVTVTDDVADPVALRQVFDDPNCFSFRELFPGGFTPSFGGEAQDMSLVGGVRGFTADGFNWDVSGSLGAHQTDLFIRDTVNASLGPATPTEFNLGSNRQRDIGLNADLSYVATDMVNIAAGAEWRNEQYQTVAGDPESWTVGPYGRGQGFSAGSNGFFGYGPMAAGIWSRRNVAVYGDVEFSGVEDDWTLGTAVRVEHLRRLRHDGERQVVRPLRLRAGQRKQRVPCAYAGAAERVQHRDHLRPGPRRPGQQRHHPVHLAGGRRCAAARLWLRKSPSTTPPAWSSTRDSSASPLTTSGSTCRTESGSRATSL